ncbi:MAG: rRNA maturation RNase YbeY [Lachnospiraceae bacterium]|nr:rRNA maturation RNase YbeY [Lachnospiraceae bacterium]
MTIQLDAEQARELAAALANENNLETEEALTMIAGRVIEAALDYLECPYEAEVNLLVTGPAEVKELNRQFRDLDQTTDVLSFPMLSFKQAGDFSFLEDEEDAFFAEAPDGENTESLDETPEEAFEDSLEETYAQDCFNPETGELLLGDIVLNEERVLTQAETFGHSVTREYAFLIIHSILHLCGYDHLIDADEITMRALQDEILNSLGIHR